MFLLTNAYWRSVLLAIAVILVVFGFGYDAYAQGRHVRSPRAMLEARLCRQVAFLFKRFPVPPPLPAVCLSQTPTPIPTPPPEAPAPEPEPEPEPSLNHLIITEVYYDLDDSHGTEPAHEWVELYNPTDTEVVLEGWSIGDVSGTDLLPPNTVIPAKSYALIVATSTLNEYWSIPEDTTIINIDSSIGNALGNSGEALALKDANNNSIDALSWGTDTNVFAIPAPDVPAGHSLARSSLAVDSDTGADWVDREVPTPGH